MANTINDVVLTLSAYVNVYTATSITVGKTVILQNKGNVPVIVQVKGSTPAANDRNGFVVLPNQSVVIDKTPAGIFALGDGPINVQEY